MYTEAHGAGTESDRPHMAWGTHPPQSTARCLGLDLNEEAQAGARL